jgi:hypothetical protein
MRTASHVPKKGWGARTEVKRPEPVPEAPATDETGIALQEENDAVPEVGAAEEDDIVLETEGDETDVTGLVDNIDEPKDP